MIPLNIFEVRTYDIWTPMYSKIKFRTCFLLSLFVIVFCYFLTLIKLTWKLSSSFQRNDNVIRVDILNELLHHYILGPFH